jgi:hypothetical protein
MYKVIKEFNGHKVGDIIELNDRRAKSEIRNENVELNDATVKKEKETIKNKIEKRTYQNKSKRK